MSALGQKQTFAPQKLMSALASKADMCSALAHVCFGPKADMLKWAAHQKANRSASRSFSFPPCAFLRPSVDHKCSGALRFARCVSVTFAGRNYRALHQHMPCLCELFRIAQASVLSQAPYDGAYLSKVIGCSATYRTSLL